MALPATDNFNRADAGSLGSNWTDQVNGAQIVSNTARAVTAGADQRVYWNADAFNSDHYSQVDLPNVFAGAGGPTVRAASGANTVYLLQVSPSGGSYVLYRVVAGGYANIGSGSGTVSPATWRLEANGSSIVVICDGSTINTHSDATITGGAAGLYLDTTSTELDNWEGGNLGGGGGPTARQRLALLGVA